MSGRIHKDDLRLDVDPAPFLDPAKSLGVTFRGQQRAAAAVKLRVQAIFYDSAAQAAALRGDRRRGEDLARRSRSNRAAAGKLERVR